MHRRTGDSDPRGRASLAAGFVALVVLLVGCTNTTSAPSAAEADVRAAETEHGTVLVDADGFTLYVFDPDEQGRSTCTGGCAASWPPLTVDDTPTAAADVDASRIGTVVRDDGTDQVTYDDWPLYRWINDAEPGDATGQGVQGVWWVISPDGTVLRQESPPAETSTPAEPGAGASSEGY